MFDLRLTAAVIVCAVAGASCAPRAVRFLYGCADAEARLRRSWEELQEARSAAGGCVDMHGVDRCSVARTHIEQLSYECPNHVPGLMANAILAYDAKELIKAQQLLDQLFGIQPAHPEAAALRGRIALEEGNAPFALRFLSEQIRLTPDHAALRETYASALFVTGRWAESRTQLDMSERLGAPKWRIDYHRGLIEESTGDLAKAREYYQASLKEKPGWKAAESRLGGLQAVPQRVSPTEQKK